MRQLYSKKCKSNSVHEPTAGVADKLRDAEDKEKPSRSSDWNGYPRFGIK